MSSLNPSGSGSATGNPRNKTALAPGHSYLDWLNLTSSGKDMSGTKGRLLNVSMEELMKHNKKTDAWLAIGGTVYNVTEYLSFHPGGEDELMKGAGIEATKLFFNAHSWVNPKSILKSCIIGPLVNVRSSGSNSEWTESIEKPIGDRISSLNLQIPAKKIFSPISENNSNNKRVFKMDWFQQMNTLTLFFYLKSNVNIPPQVTISLKNKHLLVEIEKYESVYELEEEVRWPCFVKVHKTVIEIKFAKLSPKLWTTFGKQVNETEDISNPKSKFYKMHVVHSSAINHDTKFIALQYTEPVLHYLHVGHHVQVREDINGEEVSRSYTPVTCLIKNSNFVSENPTLYLIVKEYSSGKLSRKLCSAGIGDLINVSSPRGTFNSNDLKQYSALYLFAAGTGLTPMTALISWTLYSTKLDIKLMYFNKTEQDILWREQMDDLAAQNSRFSTIYVLSQPSPLWNGEKGLVSENLVKTVLEKAPKETYICICGPIAFNDLCIKYVKAVNFPENRIHLFSG